jgi:hypothetical protein
VFSKGSTLAAVVSLTAIAGVIASIGGSWFDGH